MDDECKHGLDPAWCSICNGWEKQDREASAGLADGSYHQATCRASSCQQSILWVELAPRGNMTPVDPEPVADGNIRLLGHGKGRVMKKTEIEDDTVGNRYLTHFATCPARTQFHGGRR